MRGWHTVQFEKVWVDRVLQKQFDTVYQSILNMLFAVVDKLYP